MAIDGFDFKEFSKNLADQASQVIPAEFSDADRQYVVNIVYNFCYMAGEAIYNDTNLNFNAHQASIVTQFIGEWAFHKSIDLIKSGIEPQFRDGILQKIAFTVFEIAKQAIIKNIPQNDMISLVEHHVKKAYIEALEELKAKGAISEEKLQEAESHSNIDDMAQQAAEQGTDVEGNPVAQVSDNKILKLATLAMVVKRLPQNKQNAVLSKLSPDDAMIIQEYSRMDWLEEKIDQNVTLKCLKEIKETLPDVKKVNPDKVFNKLRSVVSGAAPARVAALMSTERSGIKNYVTGALEGRNLKLAPRVSEVVCKYLEEKLT